MHEAIATIYPDSAAIIGGSMAKKAGKKPNPTSGEGPPPGPLQQVYPTIARWASGYGWVEFGIDGRDRPFVRAQDEGGTVWEGEGRYETLDEALGAMEAGLVEFLEEEGFNEGRGGSAKKKPLAASPEKPKPRKKTPPKAPSPPKRDARVEPEQPRPSLGPSSRRSASSPTSPRHCDGASTSRSPA